MARKKGDPGLPGAGRPMGSLGKATRAEQACIKAGICPFDMLVSKAFDGEMAAIIALCKHIEPPKQALAVEVDPEKNKIEVVIRRYQDK